MGVYEADVWRRVRERREVRERRCDRPSDVILIRERGRGRGKKTERDKRQVGE